MYVDFCFQGVKFPSISFTSILFHQFVYISTHGPVYPILWNVINFHLFSSNSWGSVSSDWPCKTMPFPNHIVPPQEFFSNVQKIEFCAHKLNLERSQLASSGNAHFSITLSNLASANSNLIALPGTLSRKWHQALGHLLTSKILVKRKWKTDQQKVAEL